MNIRIITNISIILVTIIFGSCLQETHENNTNRSFFTIGSTLHMEMTLYLNDSVPANLIFDTGGALVLDSAFCASHPSILKYISITPDTIKTGSSWSTYLTKALRYKGISQNVIIGKSKAQYSIVGPPECVEPPKIETMLF